MKKYLRQLKRWEKKLEKEPRARRMRVYTIVFVISLFVGYGVSSQISSLQKRSIDELAAEIKAMENKRMQERITQLKLIRYANN